MISDIDQKTYNWLTSLKLGKRINTVSQFQNGYYFGLIFDKLNISKGKQFKNSHDMACIFQNYKNTKDLLHQNFKVQFSVNNIIYRTEQLLKTLRDACIKYQQQKKQAALKSLKDRILPQTLISQKQQYQFSLRQKQIRTLNKTNLNKTSKLPKKIQQIQKKLQKYRQEKTKHELFALQDRKRQIQQGRKNVQQHRIQQIYKLRANHEQTKQQQAKVYDVWLKTQQIKKMRIAKDDEFDSFMDQKKNKFKNSQKNQQQKRFDDGLSQFQLNCMRQGIQLEHDSTKQFKNKQDNFNSVVVMQRIKDNIKDHQDQRKQRVKRQNKKRVDAAQAKKKSQELWKQINLLEGLQKKISNHFIICENTVALQKQQLAQSQTIQIKCRNKKVIPLKEIQQEEIQKRKDQLRQNKIIYLTKQVERLQKRHQKHKSLAQDALEALLMATIFAQERGAQSQGFSYSQLKQLQNYFVSYKKQKQKSKHSVEDNQLSDNFPQYENQTRHYIHQTEEWINVDIDQGDRNLILHHQIVHVITNIIDNIYPVKTSDQKIQIPLYMPLRIGISGSRLSGKTTQIQKLVSKYNLTLIDPKVIIKEAIELAKPPAVQDPKKKKQAKKPQQQSPEKQALKKFGQQLLINLSEEEIQDIQKIKIQHFISAIKFKIELLFPSKTHQQIKQFFDKQKQKQEERLKQQLKDIEQGNKKKKDSKKGGQTIVEQQPKFNPYFYTSGFVIDNLPINPENLLLIERSLNGYVMDQQKINPLGQQIKEKLSQILPIPERQKDLSLKKGFFNMLLELNNLNKQNAESRNTGRKLDPQTQIIYHQKFNPIPTDVKGLAEKLLQLPSVNIEQIYADGSLFNSQTRQFYINFGNERVHHQAYCQLDCNQPIQVLAIKVNELVYKVLDIEYQQINITKEEQKEKEEKSMTQQNKAKQIGLTENQNQDEQFVQNQIDQTNRKGQQGLQELVKAQQSKKNINIQNIIPTIIHQIQIPILANLLDKFKTIFQNYKRKISVNLHQFQLIRKGFQTQLIVQQKLFISIINRPDDKAGKILSFQDNYNKLLQQRQNIIKDKQATKHLIQKLDQLYDSLWVSIQSKKNQAVHFRQNFIYSNWINEQAQSLAEIFKQILQNQLNYILQTLFFILLINLAFKQDGHQPVIDYLCLGISMQDQPISTIDLPQTSQSQRIQFYLDQTQKCLQQIPEWFKKKQIRSKTGMNESLQNLAQVFIKNQSLNVSKMMRNLKQRMMERIRQQICYYKCLVNKMDDWIIVGIKAENDFVYQIYKNIKKSITQVKKSSIKDLFPKQITLVLAPIQGISSDHIPIPSQQYSLQIFSFKIFIEEIKCLSYYKNQNLKINFARFKQYFQKRKKSNLLHQQFLKLDYDTTQQYLVSEGQCNYKQIALAMLFWNKKILDLDSIKKYQKELQNDSLNNSNYSSEPEIKQKQGLSKIQETERQNQQSDILKNQSQLSQKNTPVLIQEKLRQNVTFQQFFLPECLNLTAGEYRITKKIICHILKEQFSQKINLSEWIDILKMFNLLQIYKFGDALMMLNEQKK